NYSRILSARRRSGGPDVGEALHGRWRAGGRSRMNMSELSDFLVRPDGFLPKERYTTDEFMAWELEQLWPRVWQIAGRVEELAAPGDFLEYAIGDDSIVVVRTEPGDLAAFHNACRHRGTRLAEGCGAFAGGEIRCPYHAWTYALDGRLVRV